MKSDPIVETLLSSRDPAVEYKTRLRFLGESIRSRRMAALKNEIPESPRARSLLSARTKEGTIATHPYRKWQGLHWTLYSLAQISHPPGDRSLVPLRDQVYEWLLEAAHLKYPRSLSIPG